MNLWTGLLVSRRNLPCIGAPMPDLPVVRERNRTKGKPRGIRGVTDKHRPGMVLGTWELLRYIPGHRVPERVRGRWLCHCNCGCGVFRTVLADTLTAKDHPTCKPKCYVASNGTKHYTTQGEPW